MLGTAKWDSREISGEPRWETPEEKCPDTHPAGAAMGWALSGEAEEETIDSCTRSAPSRETAGFELSPDKY